MKTFVIAEAGANHNRDYDQAIKLIDVAKESGANACKFQTYSSETLYVRNTPDFAGYHNINKLIKDIELPREWQSDLKKYCDEVGIEFMSTPFDERAVQELVDVGVNRFKIAGFESSDFRFVEMVASARLPIIISIGIGFPWDRIEVLDNIAQRYEIDMTLLHCNNAYPTPMEDINLLTLNTLREIVDFHEGFSSFGLSDHTESFVTPSWAVAMGATVIEKHFTLDKTLPGPDHPFAVEPDQLKAMIDLIRVTELALGSPPEEDEEYTDSEKNFKMGKRSVVTLKPIKKGEVFTMDNITTKRPFMPGNVPASDFGFVVGRTSDRSYDEDEFIFLEEYND